MSCNLFEIILHPAGKNFTTQLTLNCRFILMSSLRSLYKWFGRGIISGSSKDFYGINKPFFFQLHSDAV